MCSINLANKFNLTENIILNLIKINVLSVVYMSPSAITNLVVYILYRLVISVMLSAQVLKLRGQ